MELQRAILIAEDVKRLLSPHCIRCEIAGSIRRRKPEVKDIEIVAIPNPYQHGLFEDGIAGVVSEWGKVKGELEYGKCKYTQRILPGGIKLDLFFADNDNFGNIMLIRTGDWEFSKKFMGSRLPQNGYKSIDGYLTYNNKIISVPNETDLFTRAGIKYIEPENRNVNSI